MKSRKIYIILFIILYVFVALVSGIHGFAFFGLANVPLLAVMLAIAFEIGQAAVLFSILTDVGQRKKVMPWVLMGIFTLVQIMGNVYNSYKYLITNAENNLRFFKEPIFIWITDMPDAQANVILSYIQGAILPVCALLLTSMVASFLTKKEEPTGVEYVQDEEEPEGEEVGDIDDTEETTDDEVKNNDTQEIVDEPHKDIYIPLPKEENKNLIIKEEFPVKEENKEEKPIEEIKGTDQDGGVIGKKGVDGMELLKETEEKPIEFPHEIIEEKPKKSHFLNL